MEQLEGGEGGHTHTTVICSISAHPHVVAARESGEGEGPPALQKLLLRSGRGQGELRHAEGGGSGDPPGELSSKGSHKLLPWMYLTSPLGLAFRESTKAKAPPQQTAPICQAWKR